MKRLTRFVSASVVFLSCLVAAPAKAQDMSWDDSRWCFFTIVQNEPNSILPSMDILQTMNLPPDEGYGEEVRRHLIFTTSELYPRQIEAYCSLMDMSSFGDYGGRPQVEVYIPTTTRGEWLLYRYNGLADYSLTITDPLWDGWIN